MIDTTKFYFYMTRTMKRALESNAHFMRYGNRTYLKHPFGFPSLCLWIDREKSQLCIEVSPPKLFQGHNVFGTNKVHYLCINVIAFIYKSLGLDFTTCEQKRIIDQGIRLGRLDTTCSFSLSSQRQISETLDAIQQHFHTGGREWAAYGSSDVETVYNQCHSTRVSDKFYNKHSELMQTGKVKMPTNVIERELILDWTRYLLRYEVTWRAKELARRRLEYTESWTPNLVRELLTERLEQLKFQGITKASVEAPELEKLKSSSRMFYRLWAEGSVLHHYRQNRTLKRARDSILLDHQVDIFLPPKTGCSLDLSELSRCSTVFFTAPKSLIRRGAIFGMR